MGNILVENESTNVDVTQDTTPVTIQDLDSVVIISQPAANTVSVNEVPAARVTVVTPGITGSGGGSGSGVTLGDPFDQQFIAHDLVAGLSDSFDCSPITNGRIGRLWGVSSGSSIPLKIEIEIVNGSRVTKETIYKLWADPVPWFPPDPRFFKINGDGSAHFGVTVTNLDVSDTSDVSVTVYWDEVDN